MTKQISGDQLQYLIEDYLLTLDDAENEEFCVSAREHARREVSGFVEWLNKRTADEPPAPHDYLRMLARLKWANCRVLDRALPEMVFVNRRVWDEVFLALGPLDDPDAKPENRQAEPTARHTQYQGEKSWTFHQACQCGQCRYAYAQIQAAQSPNRRAE